MRLTVLTLCLLLIPVCSVSGGHGSPRPTTWEDLGGVKVGKPQSAGRRRVKVPIQFDNPYWKRKANSLPPKVNRISAEIEGRRVYLQVILMSGASLKSEAPKEVTLTPGSSGPHEIYYRDPDGTLHKVATVHLGLRPGTPRSSSLGR